MAAIAVSESPRKDLSPTDHEAIQALVEAWLAFPGKRLLFSEPLPPSTPLLPELMATITRRPRYREQVIADASLWSRLGQPPTGIGREHFLQRLPAPAPFDGWEVALHPVALRVEWARTMPGLEVDYFSFAIDRLVLEDGEWRVAQLYGDRDRDQVCRVIDYLDAKHGS